MNTERIGLQSTGAYFKISWNMYLIKNFFEILKISVQKQGARIVISIGLFDADQIFKKGGNSMQDFYRHVDDLPIIMTIEEVGKLLRISRSGAYALAKKPGFPVICLGSRKTVNRDELLDWLAGQRIPLSM